MDWLYILMPIAGVKIFWPGLIILGIGVGVIGGFFGMGGAWMVTPGLNILGFPMAFATAIPSVKSARGISTEICPNEEMTSRLASRPEKLANGRKTSGRNIAISDERISASLPPFLIFSNAKSERAPIATAA